MTTTATPGPSANRRFPGWLKGSLLATLVAGICWLGAIAYWRATDRTPAMSDLVLHLLALPLALIMASGFARTRIFHPAGATGPAAQPRAAKLPSARPPLALVAAALRSPHGESAEELATAIADNKARADLDRELVDHDGFPVMTVRSGDQVDETLQEEMIAYWAANGSPDISLTDERWRPLAMATAVVGELASRAACDLMPAEGAPPMLQLVPILPPAWHIDDRRLAGMWFRHTVAKSGWPTQHIALVVHEHEFPTPFQILERLAQDAMSGTPIVALVSACTSHIAAATVASWEEKGFLFAASKPDGLIPGEGAAGLLVTDHVQARALDDVAYTLIAPFATATLETSADASKRADQTCLTGLTERALEAVGASLADVAMVIADTGHRSNRVLELMGFASGAMPQLDGVADVVRVSAASGTCGAVPFVTALALARHHALERNAPVLCISNEDPYVRCCGLVQPADSTQLHASA